MATKNYKRYASVSSSSEEKSKDGRTKITHIECINWCADVSAQPFRPNPLAAGHWRWAPQPLMHGTKGA